MTDYDIVERFHSKRNRVSLVRLHEAAGSRLAVFKEYGSRGRELLESEYENIMKLRAFGIPVPRILSKTEAGILMEYIEGQLVTELAERLDTGEWVDSLALWMAKLHSICEGKGSLLKGDVNLRNFIYSGGQIYGLDFETTDNGDPRTDLANLCFFLLTNFPSYRREKHLMLRRLLKSYEKHRGIKLESMGRFLLQSRAESKIRRALSGIDVLR